MVGDPVLGKVIGADLAASVAGAHLGLPLLGDGGVLPLLLRFIQTGAQDLHGPLPVLVLAAFVLTLHHRAGGQVGDADGGLRLVDVLAACAAGAVGVDLQVLGVDGELHLLRLGHDGHGGGGGLDTAGGFRFRHTLHPMGARFKFQAGVSTRTFHRSYDFLHAAQLRLVEGHHVQREAPALGVHGVHPQQVGGKQRALLAADTGPDLQHHALVVVGVFGQQQTLQLVLQPLPLRLGGGQLLLPKLLQLRVGQHARGGGNIGLGP